jgi:alanine racemase
VAFITINREKFHYNLHQIAQKVGSKDKIAIVLKDNAYGHGLELMARLASDFGIKEAVVRNYSEAVRVQRLFDRVLILSGEARESDKFTYAINSLDDICRIPKNTKVELKVDTGMHRNGIRLEELEEALEQIERCDLKLVGLMTHYRNADELTSELFWQKRRFEEIKQRVREYGYSNIRMHSCNSSASLRLESIDEDIVRIGISAYGYNELSYPFDTIRLKPILTLYASKVSTRELKKGERVGYGGSFIAPKDMTISTYDLGYGDGWCRGDSSRPYTTSEGLCIIGRVSMDLISLESSKQSVAIMDNAQKASRQFGTISYEVLTALSVEIPREVV